MNNTPVTQLSDASLLRRFAAWVYDLFLLFAVAFAYGGIVYFLVDSIGIEQNNLSIVENGDNTTLIADPNTEFKPFMDGPLYQLGLLLVLVGFYVLFWIKRGATLGMQTWRMELVDVNGKRPGFSKCVLRCFAAVLSFLCLGLGYFWSLYDSNNRTAHDILTGTRIVVHPKQAKNK